MLKHSRNKENYVLQVNKVIDKVKKQGFSEIRADIGDYDKPSRLISRSRKIDFMPDVVGMLVRWMHPEVALVKAQKGIHEIYALDAFLAAEGADHVMKPPVGILPLKAGKHGKYGDHEVVLRSPRRISGFSSEATKVARLCKCSLRKLNASLDLGGKE